MPSVGLGGDIGICLGKTSGEGLGGKPRVSRRGMPKGKLKVG